MLHWHQRTTTKKQTSRSSRLTCCSLRICQLSNQFPQHRCLDCELAAGLAVCLLEPRLGLLALQIFLGTLFHLLHTTPAKLRATTTEPPPVVGRCLNRPDQTLASKNEVDKRCSGIGEMTDRFPSVDCSAVSLTGASYKACCVIQLD